MDLRDLVKLAGIVNPELLNRIDAPAEVEEADGAGFEASTTRPEEEIMDDPMQSMGSSADTSLRRYLKAKGDHVTMDEEVYPDHTVDSVSEAYAAFKEGAEDRARYDADETPRGEKKKKVSVKKAPWEKDDDDKVDESKVEEDDIDENAFNQAAAAASRAGKDSFEFGGKTHKTTMKKDTAHKLDDSVDNNELSILKRNAGI